MRTPGFPWRLDEPQVSGGVTKQLAYKPLMTEVCVNVRCIACERSLVGVSMVDRRCDEAGTKCGLRPLLSAYVFRDTQADELEKP